MIVKGNYGEELLEVLEGEYGVPGVTIQMSTRLTEDLGLDSLDLVECVMLIEEEFDCAIPQNSEQEWETVQDIYDALILHI